MMDLMCFLALLNGVRAAAGPVSGSGAFREEEGVASTGLSTGLRRASVDGADSTRHVQSTWQTPDAGREDVQSVLIVCIYPVSDF